MARGALLVGLLVVASLAGCTGSDAPADPGNASSSALSSNATSPSTADPGEDASNASGPVESPSWEVGTWWSYRVEHALGPTTDVTLVVAEADQARYRLGWVQVRPGLPTLLFHFPPVGELSRPDLGWWYHDDTVTVLDFPLEDGKTWTGSMGDDELTYTAEQVGTRDGQPTFAIEGVNGTGVTLLEAEYSPSVGFFTKISRYFDADGSPSPGVELLEHGTIEDLPGNGTVAVPSMTDLVDHAVMGPDPETGRPPMGQPAGTFTVDEEVSWLALGAFMGGAEGAYQASWRAPDGGPEAFTVTNGPGDSAVTLYTAYPEDPAGQWEYEATAGGPGFIFLEAVAVTTDAVDVTADAS